MSLNINNDGGNDAIQQSQSSTKTKSNESVGLENGTLATAEEARQASQTLRSVDVHHSKNNVNTKKETTSSHPSEISISKDPANGMHNDSVDTHKKSYKISIGHTTLTTVREGKALFIIRDNGTHIELKSADYFLSKSTSQTYKQILTDIHDHIFSTLPESVVNDLCEGNKGLFNRIRTWAFKKCITSKSSGWISRGLSTFGSGRKMLIQFIEKYRALCDKINRLNRHEDERLRHTPVAHVSPKEMPKSRTDAVNVSTRPVTSVRPDDLRPEPTTVTNKAVTTAKATMDAFATLVAGKFKGIDGAVSRLKNLAKEAHVVLDIDAFIADMASLRHACETKDVGAAKREFVLLIGRFRSFLNDQNQRLGKAIKAANMNTSAYDAAVKTDPNTGETVVVDAFPIFRAAQQTSNESIQQYMNNVTSIRDIQRSFMSNMMDIFYSDDFLATDIRSLPKGKGQDIVSQALNVIRAHMSDTPTDPDTELKSISYYQSELSEAMTILDAMPRKDASDFEAYHTFIGTYLEELQEQAALCRAQRNDTQEQEIKDAYKEEAAKKAAKTTADPVVSEVSGDAPRIETSEELLPFKRLLHRSMLRSDVRIELVNASVSLAANTIDVEMVVGDKTQVPVRLNMVNPENYARTPQSMRGVASVYNNEPIRSAFPEHIKATDIINGKKTEEATSLFSGNTINFESYRNTYTDAVKLLSNETPVVKKSAADPTLDMTEVTTFDRSSLKKTNTREMSHLPSRMEYEDILNERAMDALAKGNSFKISLPSRLRTRYDRVKKAMVPMRRETFKPNISQKYTALSAKRRLVLDRSANLKQFIDAAFSGINNAFESVGELNDDPAVRANMMVLNAALNGERNVDTLATVFSDLTTATDAHLQQLEERLSDGIRVLRDEVFNDVQKLRESKPNKASELLGNMTQDVNKMTAVYMDNVQQSRDVKREFTQRMMGIFSQDVIINQADDRIKDQLKSVFRAIREHEHSFGELDNDSAKHASIRAIRTKIENTTQYLDNVQPLNGEAPIQLGAFRNLLVSYQDGLKETAASLSNHVAYADTLSQNVEFQRSVLESYDAITDQFKVVMGATPTLTSFEREQTDRLQAKLHMPMNQLLSLAQGEITTPKDIDRTFKQVISVLGSIMMDTAALEFLQSSQESGMSTALEAFYTYIDQMTGFIVTLAPILDVSLDDISMPELRSLTNVRDQVNTLLADFPEKMTSRQRTRKKEFDAAKMAVFRALQSHNTEEVQDKVLRLNEAIGQDIRPEDLHIADKTVSSTYYQQLSSAVTIMRKYGVDLGVLDGFQYQHTSKTLGLRIGAKTDTGTMDSHIMLRDPKLLQASKVTTVRLADIIADGVSEKSIKKSIVFPDLPLEQYTDMVGELQAIFSGDDVITVHDTADSLPYSGHLGVDINTVREHPSGLVTNYVDEDRQMSVIVLPDPESLSMVRLADIRDQIPSRIYERLEKEIDHSENNRQAIIDAYGTFFRTLQQAAIQNQKMLTTVYRESLNGLLDGLNVASVTLNEHTLESFVYIVNGVPTEISMNSKVSELPKEFQTVLKRSVMNTSASSPLKRAGKGVANIFGRSTKGMTVSQGWERLKLAMAAQKDIAADTRFKTSDTFQVKNFKGSDGNDFKIERNKFNSEKDKESIQYFQSKGASLLTEISERADVMSSTQISEFSTQVRDLENLLRDFMKQRQYDFVTSQGAIPTPTDDSVNITTDNASRVSKIHDDLVEICDQIDNAFANGNALSSEKKNIYQNRINRLIDEKDRIFKDGNYQSELFNRENELAEAKKIKSNMAISLDKLSDLKSLQTKLIKAHDRLNILFTNARIDELVASSQRFLAENTTKHSENSMKNIGFVRDVHATLGSLRNSDGMQRLKVSAKKLVNKAPDEAISTELDVHVASHRDGLRLFYMDGTQRKETILPDPAMAAIDHVKTDSGANGMRLHQRLSGLPEALKPLIFSQAVDSKNGVFMTYNAYRHLYTTLKQSRAPQVADTKIRTTTSEPKAPIQDVSRIKVDGGKKLIKELELFYRELRHERKKRTFKSYAMNIKAVLLDGHRIVGFDFKPKGAKDGKRERIYFDQKVGPISSATMKELMIVLKADKLSGAQSIPADPHSEREFVLNFLKQFDSAINS